MLRGLSVNINPNDPISEDTNNTYLLALTSLGKNVIIGTQSIADLYEKEHISLEPESIVRLYCRWLGFIVNQKIIGDKENLTTLTMDTIKEHNAQGSQLCQIVKMKSVNDADQIEHFI